MKTAPSTGPFFAGMNTAFNLFMSWAFSGFNIANAIAVVFSDSLSLNTLLICAAGVQYCGAC